MSRIVSLPAIVVDQVDSALARLSFQSQCGLAGASPELRDAVSFCVAALGALRSAVAADREQGAQVGQLVDVSA